jgi:hypothetical protein
MTEPVKFSSRTRVAWASRKLLDQVAALLTNHRTVTIRIEVHTGPDGDDDANMTLSQGQAEAIRDYLTKKGIAEDRLVPVGMGETVAGASGKAEARVELKVQEPAEPESGDPETGEPSGSDGGGFDFSGGGETKPEPTEPEKSEPQPTEDTDDGGDGFQFGEEEVE